MNEQAVKELAAKARRGVYERIPIEALQEKLRPFYRGQELPTQNMFRSEQEYRKALIKELIGKEFGL